MQNQIEAWFHATAAVHFLHGLGWNFLDSPCPTSIKLIHPEGPEKFESCGVTFIDIFDERVAGPQHYVRLCFLKGGQRMPLHHHRLRAEKFEVISGTVRLLGEFPRDSCTLQVGDQMCPKIGELHGVEAPVNETVAYVGLCHRNHLSDVYWENPVSRQYGITIVDKYIPPHRAPTKLASHKLSEVLAKLRESE